MKLYLIFCWLLLSSNISAQTNLTVIYEQLPILDRALFLELTIRDSISYSRYTFDYNKPNKGVLGSKFLGHSTYKNFSSNKQITQNDIYGKRKVKSTSVLKKQPWKLQNETREILGYNCQKAILDGENHNEVAWFTRDIPSLAGPEIHGLPGLILQRTDSSGNIKLNAIKIIKTAAPITEPTGGKEVSNEGYAEIINAFKKRQELNNRIILN